MRAFELEMTLLFVHNVCLCVDPLLYYICACTYYTCMYVLGAVLVHFLYKLCYR